ncbi:DNA repair protein RecO [Alphaproteobacteria bacterium 46_93_T64]|nr:DNA repair protein RecO [Alphaproteobacteria bacterium 46_93_T64]
MHWIDDGLILSAKKYGENSVILQALTREHGRHAGLVRGGTGKRLRGILQSGNLVGLRWQGRLSEQLGNYAVEANNSAGALLFDQPLKLAAASAALSLLEKVLPERETHTSLFEASLLLIKNLSGGIEHWGPLFVRWELGLLTEMGYGLDLSECASTGIREDLVYVSPKSGRAVCAAAGFPYHDRLLGLPEFLVPETGRSVDRMMPQQILDGLHLTGYFIHKNLLPHYGNEALPARERFVFSLEQRFQTTE